MGVPLVVLEGDLTGQELLEQALRVLEPSVCGVPLELVRFDLSLAHRRATANRVVYEAAEALRQYRVGIKAATTTPEGPGDVGSPNALLRELVGAQVILRTGRRIPGVRPLAGVVAPIAVVRMAVEDAYGAQEWREGEGLEEVAYRTTRVSRRICRVVAEFSFRHARRLGAKVFGGPKYTVSPIYEGLLKEELDAAARRHPDVPYDPQLIDAVYALLLQTTGEALVIPALNRDGDTLSDLVLQMFGSIAGAESVVLSLDDDLQVRVALAEAPHGTAPRLTARTWQTPWP
jgi:isocitrate dehydrogenase